MTPPGRVAETTCKSERFAWPRRCEFDTGGPAIRGSSPAAGDQRIDEGQLFVLTLDAEPTPASLRPNVWFVVEGLADRIGADVLYGQPRADALRGRPAAEGPVVVVRARQRFPSSAKVRLVWAKGITSVSGVATAEDQTLDFKTRGSFTVEFHCERENREAGCNPFGSMGLRFSAPLPERTAARIALVGPDGKRYVPETDGGDAYGEAWYAEEGGEDWGYGTGVVFPGPFPEGAAFRLELPSGVRDTSGRPLANAGRFPLAVKTAEYPPLAKFAARFGIVEWKAEPALPVTVRNLEPAVRTRLLRADREAPGGLGGKAQELFGRLTGKVYRLEPGRAGEIQDWLRRLAATSRRRSIFAGAPGPGGVKEVQLPRAHGPRAFEVVGIPLPEPGFYLVEIESARLGASLLGQPQAVYVPAAALVTNLSVHLKWGREDALAWVTTLDAGRPVPGAAVTVHDCRGRVLWTGQTDAQGLARIGKLPEPRRLVTCDYPRDDAARWADVDWSDRALGRLRGGLFVTAQSGNDLSFVHSSWQDGIEPWRFRLPDEYAPDPLVAHTILDRMLFRAGETVHMKHVLRVKAPVGFAEAAAAERPATLAVVHEGSDERRELPLVWDPSGIAETTFAVPKEAKLGRYLVVTSGRNRQERITGSFQVEEFRVPLMKGTIKPPAAPQVAVKGVPLDLSVQYLAGGGASQLPVTLRSQLRPARLPPFGPFEDFVFANGPVAIGPGRRPPARYWSEYDEWGEGVGPGVETVGPAVVGAVHQTTEVVLDANGTARTAVTDLPVSPRPLELLAEMEFRDPNGEAQTVAQTVTLWPARWLVGIRTDGWLATKERVAVQVAVVDVRGKPVRGAPVAVRLFQHRTYSHRKRLAGGFYGYEHAGETTAVGEFCRGQTDPKGRLFCEGKAPVDGHLVLEARVTGAKVSGAPAHDDVWVAGSEDWWFTVAAHDRMDLLPEQRRYEPGQTAKVQVRMPFREAAALVTLEREGRLLDASVATLSGKSPVVEVPITDALAPNVFVSVLAVRGRVGGVQPTALVDLGRPAFKLGVTELAVGWQPHELKVTVAPDRAVYQVRETATVRVRVRTARGAVPPAGSEIALAAVDEGLLELMPNPSWRLLDAMMGRRWHGVGTATAQMQVIGKRHYGLKALPQGGGGGRQPTRELFDTLLAWQGRVPLDAKGEAAVKVPLNDSLTAFRIVAVATGGAGLFGTGEARIRSTRDLMLLPGVAPLVREGDRFRSEFTLRNTTRRPMDVAVAARVEGLPEPLAPQQVALAAGASAVVGWEVAAPAGAGRLRYEVEAREAGGRSDRLRVEQAVRPATPVRTLQATLFQLEGPSRRPLERPLDAVPGSGDVRVLVAPSLLPALDGVREWWRLYPYACLEQKVSKAVGLRDEGRWREVRAAMPAYLDGGGLLKYFPAMERGSVALTAYVLALAHESGWDLPPEVLDRTASALARFVDGSLVEPSPLPAARDLTWRKLAALEALSRYGRVEPRLVSSLTIDPNLWPTSAALDWWNVLHRTPRLPDREARLREVERVVRARLNLQGTRMGFSTEGTDHLWWLMTSPDGNAVRLLLTLLETGRWREDVPRLVRGAFERQRRGAWDVTVTNAWGVLAVEKFARAFEAAPVAGTTTAELAGRAVEVDWTRSPAGDAVSLPWPSGRAELALAHEGSGRPWVTIQSRAAVPLQAPLSSGYAIGRTVTPIVQREAGRLSRGDVLRVRLDVEAQSDMTWVVVSDPVPAGASHLGGGLARGSRILTQGEQARGWAWPAFEERAFEAFRAYYAYVPKGQFSVEYTIRLNQAGRLQLPPTRVEAMYAPEMFGELPNATLDVQP